MAELRFNVQTDWSEVEKLVKQIDKLNSVLANTNTNVPREEVDKLSGRLEFLKTQLSKVVSATKITNEELTKLFGENAGSKIKFEGAFDGLSEEAQKAVKTASDLFDSLITKIDSFKSGISDVVESLGSIRINKEAEETTINLLDQCQKLTDATEQQYLSITKQATENNNILQQQQSGLTAINQQNIQHQNISDTLNEQIDKESEMTEAVENTTAAVETKTEAIKEQRQEQENLKEGVDIPIKVDDVELENVQDKIASIRELIAKYEEELNNAPKGSEEYNRISAVLENYRNNLALLIDEQDKLEQKTEEVSESVEAVYKTFKAVDSEGNVFEVMAESVEDSDNKLQRAKDSLMVFPEIMQRISEKADEMRLGAYMTKEGENLVKEAESISRVLSQKKSISEMFNSLGQETGTDAVSRLSDIEEKLSEIHTNQKEIEEEAERQAEQERILAEQAEQRKLYSGSITTQIRNAREEMVRLANEGKQGTAEYARAAQRAGELRQQMTYVNAQMQYMSDNNRGLTTLKTGLQGVAGAVGLVNGVIGIFNKDAQKMAEIQTKIQSVLGVVVGLETTYNLVKKESVIRLAIEEVRTWAVAKARGVQAAATTAATTAQEGLNQAMIKTPYGAIIALLVTLGAAIWGVTKALTSETEAEKKAKKEKEEHTKKIKEQQESWANSVADSAAKQILAYRKLQEKWNKLGNDLSKKKKFITDNKDAFSGLGVAIDSVTAAENVFVNNSDAVVNAIMARAKAAAYEKTLQEQYEAEIKERIKADRASKSVENGGSRAFVKAGDSALGKQRSRAYYNAKQMGYKFEEGDTENGVWTEKGAKRIEEYNKKYQAQQKKAFEEREKQRRKNSEKEIKATEKLVKEETKKEAEILKKSGIEQPIKETKQKTGKTAAELAQEKREIMDKQAINERRAAEDLEFSTRDARIKAMKESNEKVIAQLRLDYDKEIKAIERSYEDMKLKRVEAAKQLWESDTKNKGKNFYESQAYKDSLLPNLDESGIDREKENFNERILAANETYKRSIEERQRAERQATYDLLKTWGDYEQQKFAIIQSYEEKIRKASSPQEAAGYQMQRDKEVEELGKKEIEEAVDWNGVFSELQGHTKEYLEGLRDQLQALLATGKVTDVTQLATIQEKIREINGEISKQGGLFDFVGDRQREHNRLVEEAAAAEQRRKDAYGEQINLEARQNFTETSIRDLFEGMGIDRDTDIDLGEGGTLDSIKELYGEESEQYKKLAPLLSTMATNELKLAEARKKTDEATKDAKKAEDSSKRKSAQAVADWFSDAQQFISEKGIDQIPDLLNEVGLGSVGDKAAQGLSAFNNAAGAAADFAKGNYVGAALKGISAVNNFGEALGVWSNSNRAEVERENKRLAIATEVNTQALNKLTDAMKDATPTKAFEIYEQAKGALKANEQNARQTMINNAYMYDGGHSLNYDLGDDRVIRQIFNMLGKRSVTGAYDLGALLKSFSAEELGRLNETDRGRALLTQLGQAIANAEDDGNYNGMFGDLLDYINTYSKEAYQDLIDQFNETVTHISFDSMYSSFVSSLMDMDKKAKDFTNDFEGYMRNAIYESMAAEQIKPLLEQWYGAFASFMSNDGKLDANEIAKLKNGGGTYKDQNGETKEFKSLTSIEDAALKMRDGIEQLGLYNGKTTSQSATANSLSNISYDQADSIVGIETAQLIELEAIRAIISGYDYSDHKGDDKSILTYEGMVATSIEQRDIARDSRDILAGMAIHVEEIRDGVVDTIVPRIKNIDNEITRVRKVVEENR